MPLPTPPWRARRRCLTGYPRARQPQATISTSVATPVPSRLGAATWSRPASTPGRSRTGDGEDASDDSGEHAARTGTPLVIRGPYLAVSNRSALARPGAGFPDRTATPRAPYPPAWRSHRPKLDGLL